MARKTGMLATCEEVELRSPLSSHEFAQVTWCRCVVIQIKTERCF